MANKITQKQYWAEIIIKNLLLLILAILVYPIIESSFSQITDKDTLGTLIIFVGLIIVVPLFWVFSFTYETISTQNVVQRYVWHLIAFFVMLWCFWLLEMIDVLFVLLVWDILIFRVTLLILIFSIFLYDFWDAARIYKNSN